jgi:hypothetical protein
VPPGVVRLDGVVQWAALWEFSGVAVLRQRHGHGNPAERGRDLHRSNANQRRDAREYATLEAPTMTLVPTGTPAGATVCLGDVRTIVWIFGR